MKEFKKSIVNETVGTLAAELEAQLNDTPFGAYRSTKFQKYIFLFCVSFSLYSPSNLPRLF